MSFLCTRGWKCVGIGALLLIALPSQHAHAEPLAMPGYTWGTLNYPNSPQREERENLILEGAIEQGVDWMDLGAGTILNTFGRLRYVVDTDRFDFNNKIQPELGIKLQRGVGGFGVIELGAKYVVEYRFVSGRTEMTPNVFLNWAATWNLQR